MEEDVKLNGNVVVVCGVALRGDKVLLIRSKRHGVATPGGKVRPGESFEQALRRELLEETGMTVTRVVSRLGVEVDNGFEVHTFHVEAEGEPVAGDDAEAVWWGDPYEVRDSPIPRDYPWIVKAITTERLGKAHRESWAAYREEVWEFAKYRDDVPGGQPAWLAYLACGLCGEAAELNDAAGPEEQLNELADVVWYFANVERETGIAAAWPDPIVRDNERQKEAGNTRVGAAIFSSLGRMFAAGWEHTLLASACRVAECLKRPIRGRRVDPTKLKAAIDGCASAIHGLSFLRHGGVPTVTARSIAKVRGEFGGRPWSSDLMAERDDRSTMGNDMAFGLAPSRGLPKKP